MHYFACFSMYQGKSNLWVNRPRKYKLTRVYVTKAVADMR